MKPLPLARLIRLSGRLPLRPIHCARGFIVLKFMIPFAPFMKFLIPSGLKLSRRLLK